MRGPSSRAFRSQRPTTVLDIAADAPSRSWETVAAQQGYSSLLAVPLVVGQTPFGLITCYTAEKHQFSAREIILMESMANQAGLAIETARRLAEAQERADRAPRRPPALRADLEAHRHADANHRELLRSSSGRRAVRHRRVAGQHAALHRRHRRRGRPAAGLGR